MCGREEVVKRKRETRRGGPALEGTRGNGLLSRPTMVHLGCTVDVQSIEESTRGGSQEEDLTIRGKRGAYRRGARGE